MPYVNLGPFPQLSEEQLIDLVETIQSGVSQFEVLGVSRELVLVNPTLIPVGVFQNISQRIFIEFSLWEGEGRDNKLVFEIIAYIAKVITRILKEVRLVSQSPEQLCEGNIVWLKKKECWPPA